MNRNSGNGHRPAAGESRMGRLPSLRCPERRRNCGARRTSPGPKRRAGASGIADLLTRRDHHASYRITLDMYVGTTADILDRARHATQ